LKRPTTSTTTAMAAALAPDDGRVRAAVMAREMR